MRRRPFARLALVAGLAVLTACANQRPEPPPPSFAAPGAPGVSVHRVAILVPLTGPNAGLGQDLLKAAQLALPSDSPTLTSPGLTPYDTLGTADGAAAAARAAVAAHDEIILGPLTNAETAAAAGAAAGTPMLAFTSDAAQARPGVWTLGITADQQVRRLIRASQAQGKSRLAAVLPDNPFGTALNEAFNRVAGEAGAPPPAVHRYAAGFANANAALRDAADYGNRRGGIEARVKAARARGDSEGRREGAEIAREPVTPAPFDALLITEPGLAPLLTAYDVAPPAVQVLGPTIWARDAANLGALAGAWYAAPDPATRAPFEQAFSAKYGATPPALADLAFDAANVARVAAADHAPLTRPEGFAGVDGVFGLAPDGRVRRSLAIFEIGGGGAHIVDPAATALPPPGS